MSEFNPFKEFEHDTSAYDSLTPQEIDERIARAEARLLRLNLEDIDSGMAPEEVFLREEASRERIAREYSEPLVYRPDDWES
jgi:hypothetical protein